MSKKKTAVKSVHSVGDDIWFAWVGYRQPFAVEATSVKVLAVGPLQTTLANYPPYQANEGSHRRNRLRGKTFETGTRHPVTRDEAVQLLLESLLAERQNIIDSLGRLQQKIDAVRGEP